MSGPSRRAAQYLRMSSDQQTSSLANQTATIAEYAAREGLGIARSYVDAGISGLTFYERAGLRRLVADVVSGAADFSVLLVADVSRWGRFQDPDEAAHYEFLCQEAGIEVRYCGEPEDVTDGPLGGLFKHIKRVMAGEFSREKSEVVRVGKKRAAAAGRKQGGPVPFGLARVLVNPDGSRVGPLRRGERKALDDQYVVFALGPEEEVAAVKEIFRLFVEERKSLSDIARRMAETGPPRPRGGPWTAHAVRKILTCELYAGVYVYNRSTQALRTRPRPLPPSEWVRAQVMEPVVTPEMFHRARELLAPRNLDEDLSGVRRLLAEEGRLNAKLIAESPYTASLRVYYGRFGSLEGLYAEIGYTPGPKRRVSDARLLDDLRALKSKSGLASGTLLKSEEGLHHRATYRRRFGSLKAAYELAGLEENATEVRRAARSRRRKGGPT
ncbi:MAG: recombinase family protein [Phenylobacterium sp.]|uniref:recombinase family protein n=1 Tax=Phenylobacterium sp. TaxID=1871053 RepID=UPI003566DC2B